jgi:hypothetical protein
MKTGYGGSRRLVCAHNERGHEPEFEQPSHVKILHDYKEVE